MDIEKLIKLHDSDNIAEDLDDELLNKIGSSVVRNYQMDKDSRSEWELILDKGMDIARQTLSAKMSPWDKCANVKFPLITQAAIQFAARTYPELINDGRVVEAYVSGDDPDGKRSDLAKRISAYMSFQLLVESDEWEPDTDKLLHMLPVIGTVFRKTYYDAIEKKPCSELCEPKQIVIHNSAKSLEKARRVSHLILFYKNDIIERQNAGLYCDYDLCCLDSGGVSDENKSDSQDEDKQYDFIEQHTFWDLDDDGYQEPYIITVHLQTEKVFRIVSRFDREGIKTDPETKELLSIKPVQYFTDYHFIPSPDGSFYSLGFGNLLYPLNEAINTLHNQLLDAGTLANQQSGFLGNAIRMDSGDMKLAPGEWKKVQTSGQDLQSNVYPLPAKDPSQTLFNLLQSLIKAGEGLTGVIDILPDNQQTQNVPATTILALLDQRLKPLKSIFKRIYRSFKKEFTKLYRLNSLYLPDDKIYFSVLNNPSAISKEDFKEPNYFVKPIADPSMASESQRILKAQMLRGALNEPGGNMLNAEIIMKNWVKELNIPASDMYLQKPQMPPNPDMIKIQMEQEQNKERNKLDYIKLMNEAKALHIKELEAQAKITDAQSNVEKHKAQAMLDIVKAKMDVHDQQMKHMTDMMSHVNESHKMLLKSKNDNKRLDIEQQKADQDKNDTNPASIE